MNKRPLISRVPGIWRRLDPHKTLAGFLEGEDNELLRLAGLVKGITAIQNPDTVPDRYLRIAGNNKGHVWRSDKSFEWNRKKIETAITRYSRKGSYARLGDELREINADGYHVQDQASQIIVLSRQGKLSKSRIVDADFWHEGVFVIYLQDAGAPHVFPSDIELLIEELKPAGEIWFTVRSFAHGIVFETGWQWAHGQTLWTADTMNQKIGCGKIDSNLDDSVSSSYKSLGRIKRSAIAALWRYGGDTLEGRLGCGALGTNGYDGVITGHKSSAKIRRSFIPIKWHFTNDIHDGMAGYGIIGLDLDVSYNGQRFYRPKLPVKRRASAILQVEVYRTFIKVFRHISGQTPEGKIGHGAIGLEMYISYRGSRFYHPSSDPQPTSLEFYNRMEALLSRKTFQFVANSFDFNSVSCRSTERFVACSSELGVAEGLTVILQLRDSQSITQEVEAIRRTTIEQTESVFQGVLTTDSNLPANIEFPANTGHFETLMTEEEAATQVNFQTTTYLFTEIKLEVGGEIERNQGGE